MKLTDLIIKEKVTIQIVWDEQKIEFLSSIVDKDELGVFIEPYLHNGQPLELNIKCSSGVVCNLFTNSPVDNQRISWRNVDLESVNRDGELAYYIKTSGYNQIARSDERRKADRMVIRKNGQLYDSQADKYVDILIHDISDVGISFYAPPSYIPETNQLTVLFTDSVEDKFFDIKVVCTISRTQKRAGNIFNGCKLVGENKDYLFYRFFRMLSEKNSAESND